MKLVNHGGVNMPIKYSCNYKNQEWAGTIKEIRNYGSYAGCVISGRGSSINAYIGKADEILWICFPNHNLSSTLSKPDDIFWNSEKLGEMFNSIIDGITIAQGIKQLNDEGIIS